MGSILRCDIISYQYEQHKDRIRDDQNSLAPSDSGIQIRNPAVFAVTRSGKVDRPDLFSETRTPQFIGGAAEGIKEAQIGKG